MSVRTSLAPAFASVTAQARPRPAAAPVTMTTLSFRGLGIGGLHLSVLIAHAEVRAVLGGRGDVPAVQFGDCLGLLEHLDIG